MMLSGVVRAVALGSLGLVFGGRGANCTFVEGYISLRKPTSLKDMLDYVAKLDSNESLRDATLRKVAVELGGYFDSAAVTADTLIAKLKEAFTQVIELRKALLKEPTNFGNYIDADEADGFEDRYAATLIDILPVIHNELSYLYFQTAQQSLSRGGMKWVDNRFGPSVKSNLNKWLYDEIGKGAGLIKRGFTDKNLITVGYFTDPSILGINIHQGGPLNHAQFGLPLVDPKWKDANLANGVLLLKEFCKDILSSKFVEQFPKMTPALRHDVLKDLCFKLSTDLNNLSLGLLPLFENIRTPEDSTEVIRLETKYDNIYNRKLKDEYFAKYIEWMRKHSEGFTASLEKMAQDSVNWTLEDLTDAASEGPFKYGFVFTEHWHDFVYRHLKDTTESIAHYFKEIVSYANSGSSILPADPALPMAPESTPVAEETTREDGNLRTADDAVTPKESESPAKPSSFVSTPFVGCFVTLGFLLSMM